MQLGRLISQLENDAQAGAALEAMGDLVLFARVETVGLLHEETPAEYLANAARRYANLASDEDWLGLMTAIEQADNPGRAVLKKILLWALDKDAPQTVQTHAACTCAGGAGGCHGDI